MFKYAGREDVLKKTLSIVQANLNFAAAKNTILMMTATIQTTTEIRPPQVRDINTRTQVVERKIVRGAGLENSHGNLEIVPRRRTGERFNASEAKRTCPNPKKRQKPQQTHVRG